MASLLSSGQTLVQIHNIANTSSAKIGRVTLSRNSSRNLLPVDLKAARRSTGKVPTLSDLKKAVAETSKAEWSIDIAPKPDGKDVTEESGFLHNFAFLFMTTLEVVFFGPYDVVEAR